jgi:hypothetical protein
MFLFTVENISKIKDVKYTSEPIPQRRLDKIEYAKNEGLFKDFNYQKYKVKPYPKNPSMRTYSELNFLKDLPDDKEFVTKHDNIEHVFREVCNDYNVEYPVDLVNELIKSSTGIIHDLKYHYNRPRPSQLAKEYNINLGIVNLETTHSPSYPSGHSAQGILIGKVLQTKLSINTDAFLQAGKRISYSRNVGRVHFPSDSQMGEELGDALYKYIRERI